MKISNISSSEILTNLLPSEEEFFDEQLNYLEDEEASDTEPTFEVPSPKSNEKKNNYNANLCMNRVRYDKKQTLRQETLVQTQECSICFELSEEQNLYVVEGCCHIFCSECLFSYLDITTKDSSLLRHNVCFYNKLNERTLEISSTTLFGVKCPSRGCQYLMEYHQIQELSPDLATRFNTFTCQQVVEEECNGSYPRCIQCKTVSTPLGTTTCEGFFCSNCLRKFCHECQLEPHPNLTCEYNKFLLAEEKRESKKQKKKVILSAKYLNALRDERFHHWAFGKYAQEHGISICPNCHVAIEKNGGCDHMKCRKCNVDFSWAKSERVGATNNHWYQQTAQGFGYAKAQSLHAKYISSLSAK